VDKPGTGGTQADQLFVFDHTFGVEDGDPLTDDAPPIAWNKLQLAGTKYNSHTHKDTDDFFVEGSTELVTAAIGHFDTHAKLPASASAALEVTRSEFLDSITESTAFAALVHGSVSSVVAPEPDTPKGPRSVSFLYDGSGTDFQKSVNDKAAEAIPQHYFAGFWSCSVLGHEDPNTKPRVYTALQISDDQGEAVCGFRENVQGAVVIYDKDAEEGETLHKLRRFKADGIQTESVPTICRHANEVLKLMREDGLPLLMALEDANERYRPYHEFEDLTFTDPYSWDNVDLDGDGTNDHRKVFYDNVDSLPMEHEGDPNTRLHWVYLTSAERTAIEAYGQSSGLGISVMQTWLRVNSQGQIVDYKGRPMEPAQ
jgi:hypothetical protein